MFSPSHNRATSEPLTRDVVQLLALLFETDLERFGLALQGGQLVGGILASRGGGGGGGLLRELRVRHRCELRGLRRLLGRCFRGEMQTNEANGSLNTNVWGGMQFLVAYIIRRRMQWNVEQNVRDPSGSCVCDCAGAQVVVLCCVLLSCSARAAAASSSTRRKSICASLSRSLTHFTARCVSESDASKAKQRASCVDAASRNENDALFHQLLLAG